MDRISANLAFGRREKNMWGYNKLLGGGGQEEKNPIRKPEKKWRNFFVCFFLFFGDSKK